MDKGLQPKEASPAKPAALLTSGIEAFLGPVPDEGALERLDQGSDKTLARVVPLEEFVNKLSMCRRWENWRDMISMGDQ